MNEYEAREEAKRLIRDVLLALHEGRTTMPYIEQHEAFEKEHPEIDWREVLKEVVAEAGGIE